MLIKLTPSGNFKISDLKCPPLNRIILGKHKSDNNNRMIQLTDVFCVLHRYITESVISDYNNRLIQLSVIQLSGVHCIKKFEVQDKVEQEIARIYYLLLSG